MASEIYLKLDGIQGDVNKDPWTGSITVYGFSYVGDAKGHAPREISVMTPLGASAVGLLNASATSSLIPTGTLFLVTGGRVSQRLEMTGIHIASATTQRGGRIVYIGDRVDESGPKSLTFALIFAGSKWGSV